MDAQRPNLTFRADSDEGDHVPTGPAPSHLVPPDSAVSALDRTLRLMRDDLRADVPDSLLLAALAAPRVLFVADAVNLASPAAQTALITTALLVMRSGTSVLLQAPDVPLHGVQSPLSAMPLVKALVDIGADLLPGVSCRPVRADADVDAFAEEAERRRTTCAPASPTTVSGSSPDADALEVVPWAADGPRVAILFGDTAWHGTADVVIRLSGDAVSGHMTVGTTTVREMPTERAPTSSVPSKVSVPAEPATSTSSTSSAPATVPRWSARLGVPFGALIAAGLAAGEVYKVVMRSLAMWASSPDVFAELLGVSEHVMVTMDPEGEVTPEALEAFHTLGDVDAISGGAIVQAALFSLARIPGITGRIRVIEPEAADHTNLNRYALLRRSAVGQQKAETIAALTLGGLEVQTVVARYDRGTPLQLGGLAEAVIVGVDHIPTRWAAQNARPTWLGIGATSHYSAMSSDHAHGSACAWCLHPTDAPDLGPIPTVAFVSHWAGVLLAWRLVRHRLGLPVSTSAQYEYMTPLRADLPGAMWRAPVAERTGCPNGCRATRRVA